MVAAESLPQKFLLNYRHIREMNDARFADSADWRFWLVRQAIGLVYQEGYYFCYLSEIMMVSSHSYSPAKSDPNGAGSGARFFAEVPKKLAIGESLTLANYGGPGSFVGGQRSRTGTTSACGTRQRPLQHWRKRATHRPARQAQAR